MKAMAVRPARSICLGPRTGRGGRALAGRRAGPGASRAGLGPRPAVDAPTQDGGRRGGRGSGGGDRGPGRRPGRPDPSQCRPPVGEPRPRAGQPAHRPTLTATSSSPTPRERARFDLALEAIKTFHSGVSEELVLKEKQFDGLRTKLLRGATDFYRRLEDLLAGEPDRRSARCWAGLSRHRRADGQDRLAGRGPDGTAAWAGAPNGPGGRRGARRLPEAGRGAEPDRGRRPAGGQRRDGRRVLASYQRARELLEPLARSSPDEPSDRAAVAKCLRGIARVQYHAGRAPESLASHERARAIFQDLADDHPALTPLPARPGGEPPRHRDIHRAGGHVKGPGLLPESPGHPPEARRGRTRRRPVPERPGPELQRPRLLAAARSVIRPRRWGRSSRRGRSSRAWPMPTRPSPNSRATWRRATRSSARSRTRPAIRTLALASFERQQAILRRLVAANPRHALSRAGWPRVTRTWA